MTLPRITVVIPTRERADVLPAALKTVVAQDYDRLEIIVSDNASRDCTRDVVESFSDPRIRYVNTGRRLSMSHNWEFALSHVADGWLTIIGDDDGLLPRTIQVVSEIVSSNEIQALRSPTCSYVWPSLTRQPFGRMWIPRTARNAVRDSRAWLRRVLEGRARYTDLPMLYSGGYVHTSVLKRIQARQGSFYRSCIPDVYSGVAISSSIDRYLFVGKPLAINGASRHSTGTAQFTTDPNGAAQPAELFASEPNIPMHPDVPLMSDGSYPPSLQALTYESYLQSRDLRGADSLTTPGEQLRVILETAGTHGDSLDAWGRRFAMQHQLPFERIRTAARLRGVVHRLRAFQERVMAAATTRRLGSLTTPIPDVYEASVVAGPL